MLQVLSGGWKSYIQDAWNKADQAMYGVLLVAVLLRFTLTGDEFVYVRYVYAVDFILFTLRILHYLYFDKRLGSKVIVIWRMVCVFQCWV